MKISCLQRIKELERKIDIIIAQLKRIANITILIDEEDNDEKTKK